MKTNMMHNVEERMVRIRYLLGRERHEVIECLREGLDVDVESPCKGYDFGIVSVRTTLELQLQIAFEGFVSLLLCGFGIIELGDGTGNLSL